MARTSPICLCNCLREKVRQTAKLRRRNDYVNRMREQLDQFATDPAAFRASLLIDTDSRLCRFADVMGDWKAGDFRALNPGFMRAVGHRVEGDHSRAWLE